MITIRRSSGAERWKPQQGKQKKRVSVGDRPHWEKLTALALTSENAASNMLRGDQRRIKTELTNDKEGPP